MVVYGASIMDKSGKVLIFRQTFDVTSARVEQFLPAFPVLVGTSTGIDNPYVDGENVRYLYRPFDAFNLVLVTDKHHCDMDYSYDFETMMRIYNFIPKVVPSPDEESICRETFKLTYMIVIFLDHRGDKYKNLLKRKAAMFPVLNKIKRR